MAEPVTHEMLDEVFDSQSTNPTAVAGDRFLALQVAVLIDIREELSMLREKVSGIEMNGRPG